MKCNIWNLRTVDTFYYISRFCTDLPASDQGKMQPKRRNGGYFRRFVIFLLVCMAAIGIFYSSMILTASPLTADEREKVDSSIKLLERRGFINEAYLLRDLATFRRNDNWLNASVTKENAFAATNYPFAIITLYPDFFIYTVDEVERAAILLHEARHLKGYGEEDAYEFVWRNRKYLGWIEEQYTYSAVWQSIRRQTKDYAPNLFVCDFNQFGDCTR